MTKHSNEWTNFFTIKTKESLSNTKIDNDVCPICKSAEGDCYRMFVDECHCQGMIGCDDCAGIGWVVVFAAINVDFIVKRGHPLSEYNCKEFSGLLIECNKLNETKKLKFMYELKEIP